MTKQKRVFLCVEDGEQFTIECDDASQAREDASIYNGYLVRELSADEVRQYYEAG